MSQRECLHETYQNSIQPGLAKENNHLTASFRPQEQKVAWDVTLRPVLFFFPLPGLLFPIISNMDPHSGTPANKTFPPQMNGI